MRDDAVLRRALPLGRGLGQVDVRVNLVVSVLILVFRGDVRCLGLVSFVL